MASDTGQQELLDTVATSETAPRQGPCAVVDHHSFSQRLSQRQTLERRRLVDEMLAQLSASFEDIPRTPTGSLLSDQ